MFIDRKTQFFKISVIPKLIYKFNAMPIEIMVSYFMDVNKLILMFIWTGRRFRLNNTILKDKVGGLMLTNFKTYY